MGEDLKDKKIAILGLGVEGISSLKFFSRYRAEVSIRDKKDEKDIDQGILEKAKQLTSDFTFGPAYLHNLLTFDIIVRSPSIRPDQPEILEAAHKGVKITSNTKTFFDLCPAEIIGVTGTKGKGTTAVLISEMLSKGSLRVFVGGNIGKPPLDFIDEVDSKDWVVLEMSSFQLIDIEKSPHVAVVLMVTSEHLDWHRSSEEYISAKTNIVSHQSSEDFAVINVDHPGSSGFSDKTVSKQISVSLFKEQNPGVFVKNEIVMRNFNGKIEEILPTKDIYLRGRHNVENISAAAAAASVVGVGVGDIAKVAKSFKGLPHRLEFVREIEGVKYYNDSFSTTPETAIAAIKSFTEPLILILGGSEKESDYSDLAEEINRSNNIRKVVLIGDTAEKIEGAIGKFGKYREKFIKGTKNMTEIVLSTKSVATAGDVVLLSPASASFGIFKNYKDRGEQFRSIVNKL